MAPEVKCNKCDWSGFENDLEICFEALDTKKRHPFSGCPNCKTDDYLMDVVS